MEQQIPIAEAKNKLTAIIHAVEKGSAVKLTRHGKPVAVLLSTQEYERLSQTYGNFWRSLTVLRKRIKSNGIEITDTDFCDLRDRSAGREIGL